MIITFFKTSWTNLKTNLWYIDINDLFPNFHENFSLTGVKILLTLTYLVTLLTVLHERKLSSHKIASDFKQLRKRSTILRGNIWTYGLDFSFQKMKYDVKNDNFSKQEH